jgi:hypothetical protein
MDEATALALAKAAFEEAASIERMQQSLVAMPPSRMMSEAMDFSMGNLQQYHDHQHDVDLLHNLMSLPDEHSRNQFLQLLSQQQQQEQHDHLLEAMRMRPQKHYLTISKEGALFTPVPRTSSLMTLSLTLHTRIFMYLYIYIYIYICITCWVS